MQQHLLLQHACLPRCVVEGCGGSARIVSGRGIGGGTCSSAGDRRCCFPHCVGGRAARAPASADATAALTTAPATDGTVSSAASAGGAPASLAVAAASEDISAVEPATSSTVPSAASIRGTVGGRESSTGAVSSDAEAEATPSTGGTAAPVASVARAAIKLASAAGSAGDRWGANLCGERGASTHPFDPGTVFPLEVRYSSDGCWSERFNNRSICVGVDQYLCITHRGTEFILPCLGLYCTRVQCLSVRVCVCVYKWSNISARLCAVEDENNKDTCVYHL